MQLHDVIRNYLVCTISEGFSMPLVMQYRSALELFMNTVGDMDITVLNPGHIRRYLRDIPINDPQVIRRHMACLRTFTNWLTVQNQIRLTSINHDPTHKPNGWWLIAPRRMAVKKKLPLAL